MFCRKCGSKLLDDSQFCAVCGTKVEIKQNAEVKSTTGEESSIAGLNENKSTKNIKDQGKKKESLIPIIIGTVIVLGVILLASCYSEGVRKEQIAGVEMSTIKILLTPGK